MDTLTADLNFSGYYESSRIFAGNKYNASTINFFDPCSADSPTWENVLGLLAAPNYELVHIDNAEKRQPGTGTWFTDSDIFRAWMRRSQGVLCCHGIRGSGKTMLMCCAIDYLRSTIPGSTDEITLFLYLDSDNRHLRKTKQLLSALIGQHLQHRKTCSNALKDFYLQHKRNSFPATAKELNALLVNELCVYKSVYIIVDGLDEALDETRADLIKILIMLRRQLPSTTACRLLLTSYGIETLGVELPLDTVFHEVKARDSDLSLYIKGQISERLYLSRLTRGHQDLVDRIINTLIGKAQGMFLLAYLHLELLEAAKKKTRTALEAFAKDLSPTLEKAYEALWEEVKTQDVDDVLMAEKICAWLAFSVQTIHIDVIRHAFVYSENGNEYDISDDNLIDSLFFVSCCKGLVRIQSSNQTIQFAHYTAQQFFPRFLLSSSNIDPHYEIATACLRQIGHIPIFPDVNRNVARTIVDDVLKDLPLAEYALRNFDFHASKCAGAKIHDDILTFLGDARSVEMVATLASSFGAYTQFSSASVYHVRHLAGLHLLAFWGLQEIAMRVLQDGTPIDVEDEYGWHPLRWAVWAGNSDMVRFLANKGAYLGHIGHDRLTALQWALGDPIRVDRRYSPVTARGSSQITVGSTIYLSPISSLLWTRGPPLRTSTHCLEVLIDLADKEIMQEYGPSIMLRAAEKRIGEVVTKLIGIGIEPRGLIEALMGPFLHENFPSVTVEENARAEVGWHVVIDANEWIGINFDDVLVSVDESWICQLVTKESANFCTSKGQTALSLAAEMGFPTVVQRLIEHGADVNAVDFDERTPLVSAVMRTRTQRVFVGSCTATQRAYMHIGATVSICGKFSAPLQLHSHKTIDAEKAKLRVIQILMENDANTEVFYNGMSIRTLADTDDIPGAVEALSHPSLDHSQKLQPWSRSIPLASRMTGRKYPGISLGTCTEGPDAHFRRLPNDFEGDLQNLQDVQEELSAMSDHEGGHSYRMYRNLVPIGVIRSLLSLIHVDVRRVTARDRANVNVFVKFQSLATLDGMISGTTLKESGNELVFG